MGLDERSAYMILRSLAQTGMGMTQPGDYGYDVGQQAVQQADAGLEEVARKEYEKKKKKAEKSATFGKVGKFLLGVPGEIGGIYLGGGEPDWGNIALNTAMDAASLAVPGGPAAKAAFNAGSSMVSDVVAGEDPNLLNAATNAASSFVPGAIDKGFSKVADMASSGATTASEALNAARPWTKAGQVIGDVVSQGAGQLGSISSGLPVVKQPTLDTTGLPAERASALRQEYSQADIINRRMQQDIDEAARLDAYRQGELAIRREDSERQGRRDQAYIDSLNQPEYEKISEITYDENGQPMQPLIKKQMGQVPQVTSIPIPGTIPQKQQPTKYLNVGGIPVAETDYPLLQSGDPGMIAKYEAIRQQLPVKQESPVFLTTPKGTKQVYKSQLPIDQIIPGTEPKLNPETTYSGMVQRIVADQFENTTVSKADQGAIIANINTTARDLIESGIDPGIPIIEPLGQKELDGELKDAYRITFLPSDHEPVVIEAIIDIVAPTAGRAEKELMGGEPRI